MIPFFLFYVLLDTDKMPRAIDRVLHPGIRDDFWNIWEILTACSAATSAASFCSA